MKTPSVKSVRCAIYTRVSKYDAASAYIRSQAMRAGP